MCAPGRRKRRVARAVLDLQKLVRHAHDHNGARRGRRLTTSPWSRVGPARASADGAAPSARPIPVACGGRVMLDGRRAREPRLPQGASAVRPSTDKVRAVFNARRPSARGCAAAGDTARAASSRWVSRRLGRQRRSPRCGSPGSQRQAATPRAGCQSSHRQRAGADAARRAGATLRLRNLTLGRSVACRCYNADAS
jgi:hypothetical protein